MEMNTPIEAVVVKDEIELQEVVICSESAPLATMEQCGQPTTSDDSENNARRDELREDIPLKSSETPEDFKSKENCRWLTIFLCVASLVLNSVLGITAAVFATQISSPATLSLGVDCLVDFMSSLVVIWRYYAISSSREYKACIALGLVFIIGGLVVIGQSWQVLHDGTVPTWNPALMITAGNGSFLCIALGVAKIYLSIKMESNSLFLDALNSILSALSAASIIISTVVYLKYNHLWYLEPVFSIIISIVLIIIGVHTLAVNCRNYFRNRQ